VRNGYYQGARMDLDDEAEPEAGDRGRDFLFWALRTEGPNGALFFTFHGRIALITVLVGIVGAASGIVMLINPKRLMWLHWTANMTCYVLLLITIALGIALAV